MAKNALHLINRSLVMLGATPIQGLAEKSAGKHRYERHIYRRA